MRLGSGQPNNSSISLMSQHHLNPHQLNYVTPPLPTFHHPEGYFHRSRHSKAHPLETHQLYSTDMMSRLGA